jgi:hypothetical protein
MLVKIGYEKYFIYVSTEWKDLTLIANVFFFFIRNIRLILKMKANVDKSS